MFRDDFNEFNPDNWIKGYWWMTDEHPYHPDIKREWFNRDNVRIDDGCLVLDLKYQPRTIDYTTILYSAGVVCSRQLFTYGIYEARIFQPDEGTWNAFWLYGEGKNPSEIDIMEQTKRKLSEYLTNAHITYKTCFISRRKQHPKDIKRDITGWHTYAIEWTKNKVEFYFDAHSVRTLKRHAKSITSPQRVIFNVACWPGHDTLMKIDHFIYYPL